MTRGCAIAVRAATMIALPCAAYAQTAQVIAGRVLADSARALAGAIVSVTMAPDRIVKQDTTGPDGRWRVRFEHPSGDYLVHIAAIGRTAFRKRVTAPPADSLVPVDATLASSVQQLAAVKVQATRPKPSREGDAYMPMLNVAYTLAKHSRRESRIRWCRICGPAPGRDGARRAGCAAPVPGAGGQDTAAWIQHHDVRGCGVRTSVHAGRQWGRERRRHRP